MNQILQEKLDRLQKGISEYRLGIRADELTENFKSRGFDDHHASAYARSEARRESWNEADEKRTRAYCKLAGLNYDDAGDYGKAVSAVASDSDLSPDPVLLRLRDTGGDPNNYAAYSAAAHEIYTIDAESRETVLKSEFSHYAKRG